VTTASNLIYQYWDGDLLQGCQAGVDNMRAYAERIGAEYLFEHNPRFVTNLGGYSPHYGSFKPIYDESFHKYDNVLFADTDVFAVDGLTESIFEGFDSDIGICTEPFQPKQRAKVPGPISRANDEKWAGFVLSRWGTAVPRTEDGLVKVYNSGVVLYSNAGLLKAADRFIAFDEYVSAIRASGLPGFYTSDQSYLHLMLDRTDWVEMDNDWNRFIHAYHTDASKTATAINDSRTETTKFVHIQLRSADHWDAATQDRITNLPQSEWGI